MHDFHILGMTCGGCFGAVTRAIQQLDPQAKVEGDLENRRIAVASDTSEETLRAVLERAGYPAEPHSTLR
ncbi:heavy-metal-associated domain-containing protein [Microvirga pakistanensis]|uniref:heavy-metal-associated domain-containing protein n=1 Tax=Microvirga pakistanensis TaxID=1682650 RepID=UPI00106A4DF8|nr:heavy-metal-associated domain-containing protein [Microvirga pakistanensis]